MKLNSNFKNKKSLLTALRHYRGYLFHRGLKRRFLFLGIINTILTNTILQILLVLTNTILSTFISQVFNCALGYILYGKIVFKIERLSIVAGRRYIILSIVTWNLNWVGISIIEMTGTSESLAALIMIPILALTSFYSQKNIVFK